MHSYLAAATLLGGLSSFWLTGPVLAAPPGEATTVGDAAAQRAASIRVMRESIATQRASTRAQASRSARRIVFSEPFAPIAFPVGAGCDPIPDTVVAPLIATAALDARIEPNLLRAVIHQESAFRPCALSPRGAMGLMQLMPDAAARFQVADPFDAGQNIRSGAQYLRELLDRFKGDVGLALAAYNAGPANVNNKTIPDFPETQDYVARILDELKVSRQ